MNDIQTMLSERTKTHGDFKNVAKVPQNIRDAMRVIPDRFCDMPEQRIEALDAIAGKIARIICGDNAFPDHWDGIASYAMLGKQS